MRHHPHHHHLPAITVCIIVLALGCLLHFATNVNAAPDDKGAQPNVDAILDADPHHHHHHHVRHRHDMKKRQEERGERKREGRDRSHPPNQQQRGAPPPQTKTVITNDPDLTLVSVREATERYCVQDFETLCKQAIEDQQEKKRKKTKQLNTMNSISTPSSRSQSKSEIEQQRQQEQQGDDDNDNSTALNDAVQCLNSKESQVQDVLCRAFLSSRRTCVADMRSLERCQVFRPEVVVKDRHLHRAIKMESRRARAELRRVMHGAINVSLASLSKSKSTMGAGEKTKGAQDSSSFRGGGGGASESQTEAEIRTQQQQQMAGSSPSMTASEQLTEQHFQNVQERYARDLAEAQSDTMQGDHFLAICAAHLLPEPAPVPPEVEKSNRKQGIRNNNPDDFVLVPVPLSIEGVSDGCLGGLAGRSHIFKMNTSTARSLRSLGVRKISLHKQNLDRYEKERLNQQHQLAKLKEHSVRHHLDRLDAEIESGKAKDVPDDELHKHPHDTAMGFLIRERKERERRRQLHLRTQQQQLEERERSGNGDPMAPQVMKRMDPTELEEAFSRSKKQGVADTINKDDANNQQQQQDPRASASHTQL